MTDAAATSGAPDDATTASNTSSADVPSTTNAVGSCSFPTRAKKLRAFSRPKQRQRWGDKQVLPHTNWGDLFFDLFYVAGAYNLSTIIKGSPSIVGILYFTGLFGPLMAEWFTRMMFDARYSWGDDPWHRFLELLHLCFLATAVVHIRTVDVMSNPSEYPDMFAFSIGILFLAGGNIFRCVEIRLWVDGEEAAKRSVGLDIINYATQSALYLASAYISGAAYFSGRGASDGEYNENSDGSRRALLLSESCSAIVDSVRSMAARSGARSLAETDLSATSEYSSTESLSYGNVTHIPIWLCLAGWFFSVVFLAFRALFLFPGGGKHKLTTVPMNIDFTLHRMGEWVMLLLGESILSLLIVETSTNAKYYVTFYAGIVSVILLQYLHFKSQPHSADGHAMRRHKNAGVAFFVLSNVYSFALVAVGVSYKMLVYEYTYEPYGSAGHRVRQLVSVLRNLAGGGEASKYGEEERQQRVANIFCGSMAIAWACLDLMALTHQGVGAALKRAKCQFGYGMVVIRFALVVFIATLSQYENDPEVISLVGMACLIVQVMTRILGDVVYPAPKCGRHANDENSHWPNVTEARVEKVEHEKDTQQDDVEV